jgi:hypothetical protein
MNTSDVVRKELRGEVVFTQVSAFGERRLVQTNLVVNNAYRQLAYLLGYTSLACVNRMRFGTSGTAPAMGDLNVVPVPAVGFLVTTNTFPSATSVKFTASWGPAESSPASFQEVGLFSSDGILVARVVFSPMMKSVGWTWTIEWTLAYV